MRCATWKRVNAKCRKFSCVFPPFSLAAWHKINMRLQLMCHNANIIKSLERLFPPSCQQCAINLVANGVLSLKRKNTSREMRWKVCYERSKAKEGRSVTSSGSSMRNANEMSARRNEKWASELEQWMLYIHTNTRTDIHICTPDCICNRLQRYLCICLSFVRASPRVNWNAAVRFVKSQMINVPSGNRSKRGTKERGQGGEGW